MFFSGPKCPPRNVLRRRLLRISVGTELFSEKFLEKEGVVNPLVCCTSSFCIVELP